MESLVPPTAEKSKLGQVWINPATQKKFIFTGEKWEAWTLENSRAEYEKGEQWPSD